MIKTVIFDCDGVMFDSREANRAFYNYILTAFGREGLTDEELGYVHMHTAGESINYLFQDSRNLECAHKYQVATDYMPFLPLMIIDPGLKEFLNYLRPKYKTAISTNRTTTMRRLLSVFELSGLFDMVVSALDVANPKPHPESLLKIMGNLQCLPGEVLYIGDSEVDRRAADAAGVRLVAYKNKTLATAYHVDSFEEIIPLLGQDASA